MKFEFSQQIFEKAQTSNLIKIHSVGAELLHADRQMDRRHDDVKSRFAQFLRKRLKIGMRR
jgi:hypothetical protein